MDAMERKSLYPDFFILGAAKCGTSTVHYWLSQHPEICMSEPKEPYFFTSDFELGPEHYWKTYFSHWKGERLIGDASHRNLYHSHVAERIRSVSPHAKFLVLLREPVERAWSHWWHMFTRCNEPLQFEDALRVDLQRVKYGIESAPRPGMSDPRRSDRLLLQQMGVYRTYLDTGHYDEQLDRYLKIFPKEQFKVYLLEDLKKDGRAVAREIFEFLQVDSRKAAEIDLRPRRQAQDLKWRFRHLRPMLMNFSKMRGGQGLLKRLRGIRSRPDMPEETRAWLRQHYRAHIDRLEQILQRPLERWK